MMFPFLKTALGNLFKKPSTVLFPLVEVEAKPRYRGRITFDSARCRSCGMCMKVCSPGAITKTVKKIAGGKYVTYNFDMTSCTFCAMCEDFCNENAIQLVEDYHIWATDAKDLVVTESFFKPENGKLLRDDDCVYCGLCVDYCPSKAITIDRANKTWTWDELKCVKCGLCVAKCPKECLDFADAPEEGIVFGENCVYCSVCEKQCPVGAIEVDRATKSWTINREACLKCGVCVEKCPKKVLSIGPLDTGSL